MWTGREGEEEGVEEEEKEKGEEVEEEEQEEEERTKRYIALSLPEAKKKEETVEAEKETKKNIWDEAIEVLTKLKYVVPLKQCRVSTR